MSGSSQRLAAFFIAAGTGLSLWAGFMPPVDMRLALLNLGPWLIVLLLLVAARHSSALALGTFLMLGLEVLSYLDTFVAPGSSTAGLIYVVKPFLQILVCLPAAYLAVWLTRVVVRATSATDRD